ncbi:MAG: RNA 2',3'-cyclic phosphodiesterase [Elusimicrobia bacterium]|nr:RNA 2',3'-cyclic phosphodiesterase [Candidatus Liberimonas magnetica]
MRLFIALNIPEKLKEDILFLQSKFKKALADVKWVNKDKFHLTLKFLGETQQDALEDILGCISASIAGLKPFRAAFSGTGVFPNIHRPRVVWVGVNEGKEKLDLIAKELEENLEVLGYPKEKRVFTSHLTLGRFKSEKNKAGLIKLVTENEKAKAEIGSFEVKSIDLMQSILHPEGPEYKCIKSICI